MNNFPTDKDLQPPEVSPGSSSTGWKCKTGLAPLLFALLLILQGCGYHNPYTPATDQAQPDSVFYLSVWDNRTNEMGLENLIFQKTADWLRQITSLRITADQAMADYLLSGTVLAVNYPATAFSITNTATTLGAQIRIEYRLTDRASNKTIWQATENVGNRNYPVGTDAIRSQSNKTTALEIIAGEIGEQIYLRVTDTLTTTGRSKQ